MTLGIRDVSYRFRPVGDGSKTARTELFYREEIQLALRNRGMPLEGLRYDITPTGMHYLLIHFDIPVADETTWRLRIGGLVAHPVTLDMSDIRSRRQVTTTVTMECAGNGRALMRPRALSQPWLLEAVGTARWTGTPLRPILEQAGIAASAAELLFTGVDQGVDGGELQYYRRSLTVEQAMRDEVMLAYGMNGSPLQPQHGYPLRLLVPGWYGMASVKWLTAIEAIERPFDGPQQNAYRYACSENDAGEPVDVIRVRSLMAPPGAPDFLTRTRVVEAGRHRIEGRAWAGRLRVSRVEFSSDAGGSWTDAELGPPVGRFAWRSWWAQWDATPGERVLCVRATDEAGNVQPAAQTWNYHGMGNNQQHRVDVLVVSRPTSTSSP